MSTLYDVVVVGAGIHGLCASHTFLSINPTLKLLIVDDKPSIGGAWSKEQLYPGLRSNHLQGWFEFSDFPIVDQDLGEHSVAEHGVLSGASLNAYFKKYAEHFGLMDKIRLRTRVTRAVQTDVDGQVTWKLSLETIGPDGDKVEEIACNKLIVATGQASKPLIPSFEGEASFQRPIVHSADLGSAASQLLANPNKEHFTVLGGSKSAHDAVYMFATAGKRVTWLTRRSGRGTMPMANLYTQMGPWSVWLEGLLMTRSLSWFGSAPWSTGDGFGWIRWLLHSTAAGRWLVRGYWAGLTADSLAQSGILKNEKTKTLVPDETLMWYGTQASSLNYEKDFYDVIGRDNVEVIREDIHSLDDGSVILENGRKIETDVLICATGYKYGPTFPLEPPERKLSWGVPVDPKHDDMYPSLEQEADNELFRRFPELKFSPASKERQPGLTPWRLWRFIAPPSEVCSARTLVFLNIITSYQTTLKCELTSLWAYAYLYDELNVELKSEKAVRYESTLWSRFGHWSRPMGMKGKTADFFMDSMPYFDLLLRDLGLRSWRKGWGIFGEVFGKWYQLTDYRGLIDEWKAARQASNKKLV